MKRSMILLSALLLLCGCCEGQGPRPWGWYIPFGIQLLAWIGATTIVVLTVVMILSFGEPPPKAKDKQKMNNE